MDGEGWTGCGPGREEEKERGRERERERGRDEYVEKKKDRGSISL